MAGGSIFRPEVTDVRIGARSNHHLSLASIDQSWNKTRSDLNKKHLNLQLVVYLDRVWLRNLILKNSSNLLFIFNTIKVPHRKAHSPGGRNSREVYKVHLYFIGDKRPLLVLQTRSKWINVRAISINYSSHVHR